MNVRLADRVNAPAIVKLLEASHDESPFQRHVPFSAERCMETVQRRVDAGTVIVAQMPEGRLAGMLMFAVYPCWWSERLLAGDMGLYVRPECRGRMLSGRLIAAAKARAAEMGVAEFTAGTNTGTATEAVRLLYARADFDEIGYVFRALLKTS